MHQNNQDRNPHKTHGLPMRRAEIVLRFEVPKTEATQEWLDAVVGIIKREVAADLGKSAQVEGKWL